TGLAGTYGTLTQQADGTYAYAVDNDDAAVKILAAGQTLTDTFVYTISDGNGGTATATLTVTIQGENNPPMAVADTATIAEDAAAPATGTVLANDQTSDDGETLSVSAIRTQGGTTGTIGTGLAGTYGTLTQQADGTYSYAIDNADAAVQALAVGQTLTDAFVYTLSDGQGSTTTATLTVTIQGTNDAPVAVADTATTAEDAAAPATGTVLANDTDTDTADTLTVTAIRTQGGTVGAVGTGLSGTYGTLTQQANGTYSYAVDNASAAIQALAVGQTLTDAFVYTISDGNGGTTTATLTVTIQGTNDAPVPLIPLPDATGAELRPITVTVPAGAFGDVDLGDVVTLSARLADGNPLPSWLVFDPTTRSFSGTPQRGDAATYAIVVTATDLAGATGTSTFSLRLDASPAAPPSERPPVEPPPPPPPPPPDGLPGNGGLITPQTDPSQDGLFTPIGQDARGRQNGADALSFLRDVGNGRTQGLELFVAGTVGNQVMLAENNHSFQVPKSIFRHTNQQERLTYEAKRPDGTPLPSWLQFDAENLSFSGTPPADATGTVEISIVARDARGNEATAQFRVTVGRDVDGGLPGDNPQDAGTPPPETEGQVPGEPVPGEPGADPAADPAAGPAGTPDGAPDGAPGGPAGEGEPAEEAPGPQAVLEGAGIRPVQVADAWTLATDAGSEGPASFAAQLRAAGRQGLIAEGRAILESLARAAAPASDTSTDTGRNAA
ncbi:VCBS domain-containing protein, partial [Arenibaculum sp.]|uniref:VCBS domain-containing protein n=1 Tax=Arenibaculum sp. TaxID=2865862 RepID=UPI002E1246CF|nr:VCBS domain-containing protein [Arenibaculum sp.]